MAARADEPSPPGVDEGRAAVPVHVLGRTLTAPLRWIRFERRLAAQICGRDRALAPDVPPPR